MAKKAIPSSPAESCPTCVYTSQIRDLLKETDSSWRWMEDFSPTAKNQKLMHLYDSQGRESFCQKFPNELRWARAAADYENLVLARRAVVETMEQPEQTLLVYMAHPVSGDFENNIARARRWLTWCNSQEAKIKLDIDLDQKIVVIAPWLTSPANVDHLPDIRKLHMEWCTNAAARCDEVWLVGGRISKGMREEADVAKCTRDLSSFGEEPPFDALNKL